MRTERSNLATERMQNSDQTDKNIFTVKSEKKDTNEDHVDILSVDRSSSVYMKFFSSVKHLVSETCFPISRASSSQEKKKQQ